MTDDNAPFPAIDTRAQRSTMSAQDFAAFGSQHLAYLKRVVVDGQTAFAVHAADGQQLALVAKRDVADALVRQNDLEPLSVH